MDAGRARVRWGLSNALVLLRYIAVSPRYGPGDIPVMSRSFLKALGHDWDNIVTILRYDRDIPGECYRSTPSTRGPFYRLSFS
jgi:hypothetical protein